MEYEEGVPVRVRFTPEREPDEVPIPPLDEQAGTLDPLSSALLLSWPGTVQEICSRRIESFSGSRRTLIALSQPRQVSDDAAVCVATYSRMKGFDPETLENGKQFPFQTRLRRRSDGLYEVAEIRGNTDVGVLIVHRTD